MFLVWHTNYCSLYPKVHAWHLAAALAAFSRCGDVPGYKWTTWIYCSNKLYSGLLSGAHVLKLISASNQWEHRLGEPQIPTAKVNHLLV